MATPEGGQVTLTVNNPDSGSATEEVVADYDSDPIEIGFNVTYLMDVLGNMGQDMVQIALQDNNSSALVTIPDDDQFKYVVMPMRI